MDRQHYPKLYESPDEIHIDKKAIYFRDNTYDQRSFIILPDTTVWIGSIGQLHQDIYDEEETAAIPDTTLNGRVWPGLKVISFWNSPISKFGRNYEKYLNSLEKELARYHINMKDLKFDLYDMWRLRKKEIIDPKLMLRYYSDMSETPMDSYDDFMKRLRSYIKKDDEKNKNLNISSPMDKTTIRTSGSPKTAWDSPNNIRFRQSNHTSESFYPIL